MSFIYWLSKFSDEAISILIFLIALIGLFYSGYVITSRRKYGAGKRQIPDHIVKAYLASLISQAEGFKSQLFGSEFKIEHTAGGPTIQIIEQHHHTTAHSAGAAPVLTAAAVQPSSGGGDNSAAVQGELNAAKSKLDELQKNLATLSQEKSSLEAKLAEAGKAGSAAPAATGDNKEFQEKIAKLESKLMEYEVIEDDLANLKKYMQENKQLKAQVDAMKAGGATPPAPQQSNEKASTPPAAEAAPVAEAVPPAQEKAPEAVAEKAPETPPPAAVAAPEPKQELAKAEEKAEENKVADELAGKVEESIAPAAAGASAVDPVAVAAAQTAAPVVEKAPAPTPAAPATQAAATPAAPDAPAAANATGPKQDKSDADLLNEFERMLSS